MPPTAKQLDWLVMLYVAADDMPSSSKEEGLGKAFYGMLDRLKTELPFDATVQVVLLYDGIAKHGGELIAVSEQSQKSAMVFMRDITQRLFEEHKKTPQGGGLPSVIFDRDGTLRINAGNWVTLREYAKWAIQAYPSTNTLLALVGHGAGLWTEIKNKDEEKDRLIASAPQKNRIGEVIAPQGDKTGGATGGSPSVLGLCPDYNNTESATFILTHELGDALKSAYEATGRKLDVLVLDACFMGMLEIAYQVYDYTHYVVAGQNILYAGLPYHEYIAALKSNGTQPVSPATVATQIVQLYNKKYHQESWTITAVDASQLQPACEDINTIAGALIKLIDADDSFIAKFKTEGLNIRARIHAAYGAAQKFDANIDGRIDPPSESYVDLFDFCFFLREQLGLALDDAKTDATLYGSLIKGIEAVNEPIAQLLRRIGDERQRTTAEVPIDTAVPYKPRIRPKHTPSSRSQPAPTSLILCTHTQSRQDEASYDLRHAYGLSIYLPLGKPPTTLEYYESDYFLRFAKDVSQWVQLISKLTGVKIKGSDSDDDLRSLLRSEDTYVARQKPLP